MRQMPNGQWVAFEGDSQHDCRPASSTRTTTQKPLNLPSQGGSLRNAWGADLDFGEDFSIGGLKRTKPAEKSPVFRGSIAPSGKSSPAVGNRTNLQPPTVAKPQSKQAGYTAKTGRTPVSGNTRTASLSSTPLTPTKPSSSPKRLIGNPRLPAIPAECPGPRLRTTPARRRIRHLLLIELSFRGLC